MLTSNEHCKENNAHTPYVNGFSLIWIFRIKLKARQYGGKVIDQLCLLLERHKEDSHTSL